MCSGCRKLVTNLSNNFQTSHASKQCFQELFPALFVPTLFVSFSLPLLPFHFVSRGDVAPPEPGLGFLSATALSPAGSPLVCGMFLTANVVLDAETEPRLSCPCFQCFSMSLCSRMPLRWRKAQGLELTRQKLTLWGIESKLLFYCNKNNNK